MTDKHVEVVKNNINSKRGLDLRHYEVDYIWKRSMKVLHEWYHHSFSISIKS